MSRIRTNTWQEKQAWWKLQGDKTVTALGKRNINAQYCATLAEAVEAARTHLPEGVRIGYGDSATLAESGILNMILTGPYRVSQWDEPGICEDEMHRLMLEAGRADVFFSGVNALTTDGVIVNLDSTGNRIAPIFFGPPKVVLVAGVNKLCWSFEEAMARAKRASIINNIRWGMPSPCVKSGKCSDCSGPGRACCYTQIIERSMMPNRIFLILVGESLGY